jgi:hypothetical protein
LASNKIWTLKFVAGNPELFSQVRSNTGLTKSEALAGFKNIDDRWRKWIERNGSVYKENEVQKEWRK